MAIRMIHPEHGAMHAYSTDEIAKLQKIGWSVEAQVPVINGDHTGPSPDEVIEEQELDLSAWAGGVLDGTAAAITANLAGYSNEQLAALRAAEVGGKTRKGLMAAIDAEILGR